MSKIDSLTSEMASENQFVSKLTKRLRKNGWSDEDIHALFTGDDKEKLHRGVDACAEAFTIPGELFELSVNFDRTVEELVMAGNYDIADDEITPENFPSQHSGRKNVEFFVLTTEDLFGQSRSATTEEVLDALGNPDQYGGGLEDKMTPIGRRYGIHPLLTLGAQHPDVESEGPIVDLGTDFTSPNGYRGVPYIVSHIDGRKLRLSRRDDDWHRGNRYLAVSA